MEQKTNEELKALNLAQLNEELDKVMVDRQSAEKVIQGIEKYKAKVLTLIRYNELSQEE